MRFHLVSSTALLSGTALLLAACEAKKPTQTAEATTASHAIQSPPRPVEPMAAAVTRADTAAVLTSQAASDTVKLLARAIGSKMRGYQLDSFSKGDLNGDKQPDFAVVLRAVKSYTSEDTIGVAGAYQQRVAIVVSKGLAHLRFAAYNDNVIACTECGGGGVGNPEVVQLGERV